MSKGEQPRALRESLQKSFAARLTPGRGDFSFRDFGRAPSDKNLSKNGSAHKGGSLCVKDVFAKKFFGAGRHSARGASSNFDEATSDRLVFVGRENILLGIAHCVAGVVSLCKRRVMITVIAVSTRRCLMMACSPPAAGIFSTCPTSHPCGYLFIEVKRT